MTSNGVLLPGQGKMMSSNAPKSVGGGVEESAGRLSPEEQKGGSMVGKDSAASLEHNLGTVHGIVPTLQ
jgi:hypothetical protein